MRVLVCGDRRWADAEMISVVLSEVCVPVERTWLIEGGARGADNIAGGWAELYLPFGRHERYPADWDCFGKGAGPIRNKQMLATGIDLVLAFHDDLEHSKGTGHMVKIAREAGVEVKVFTTASFS